MLIMAISACVTTPDATPGNDTALAPLRAPKTASTSPGDLAETSTALTEDEQDALPDEASTTLAAIIPPQINEEPPAEPALPAELDPESLIGQDATVLNLQLGEPDLRRREGTAEVWQYKMNTCVMDFVLLDGQTVSAWHSRHRQRGMVNDPVICRRDLAVLAGL